MKKNILLVLCCILFSMSWLYPFHEKPWLTFGSEVLVFFPAIILIYIYIKEIKMIPIAFIGVFLISFIPIIQYFFGLIYFFETSILCFVYLQLFFLMMLLGYNLNEKDKKIIFDGLAAALVISSFFTVWICLIQWLNFDHQFKYITQLVGIRPFGNMAQPNNMATLLNFGIFSIFYLNKNNKISNLKFYLLSVFLIFGLVLSYSRTGWIAFFLCLSILLILNYKKEIFVKYIVLMIVFSCFIFLIPEASKLLNYYGYGVKNDSTLLTKIYEGSPRFNMWVQMIYAIKENWLYGYGWNQTAHGQISASFFLYHSEQTSSAHNIILDLILWNGLIIGLIIVFYALYLLLKIVLTKDYSDIEFKLIILIFLVHAMLEYPQNYAYFLITIGLVLGGVSKGFYGKNIKVNHYFFKLYYLLLIILSCLIVRDYNQMKYTVKIFENNDSNAFNENSNLIVLDEKKAWINWMILNKNQYLSKDEILYYEKFVHSNPSQYNLINFIRLCIISHEDEKSKYYYKVLSNIYKVEFTYEDIKQKIKPI